jgi:hypothetical protein
VLRPGGKDLPVKNCDGNVVFVMGFLSAALLAWPGCASEEHPGPPQSGESSLGAAPGKPAPAPPNQSTPVTENRMNFPSDAGTGPFLVCDPNDFRYCQISRHEDGAGCAERWEDVAARLSCDQLPRESAWEIRLGPRCLTATWYRREHRETCYYDPRSGKLVASEAQDPCGLYCGGLRRALWNEPPEECWNTMRVEAAFCRADGMTVPGPLPVPPGVDAGADAANPPALDAARDQLQPPPAPPILDGGTLD